MKKKRQWFMCLDDRSFYGIRNLICVWTAKGESTVKY